MSFMKAAQARSNKRPVETYSRIAQLLLSVNPQEMSKIRHKFELCFMLAKEGVAFARYPSFHSLAERQGVDLGSSVKDASMLNNSPIISLKVKGV